MRIVYMGTPDFAVPTLETLIASKHEVVCVVSQPDKPRGRSGKLQMTPVKECAVNAGIPVLQPKRVKAPEFFPELEAYKPDVIVVAAFGQIIPQSILDLPRYGCINVHASLLPKYRGAAPIQWSILNGDPVTGITIMQMGIGLDTGDILIQEEVALNGTETGGSLFDDLSKLGGPMVLKTLDGFEAGSIVPTPQDEEKATHVSMLTKDMGNVDWTRSAAEIERMIRGLNPWPCAYTHWNGKLLKLYSAVVAETETDAAPGTVTEITNNSFSVATGKGLLVLTEVQLEGKKRMPAGDFLRGNNLTAGTVLGRE